ncbi:class F sortase [Streptomyces sp. NPDC051976]|uniref:class F sortase n=1 Tax=Streptomyces sp. NPDC051976 TaxID=3154947 RepID=UPI003429655F
MDRAGAAAAVCLVASLTALLMTGCGATSAGRVSPGQTASHIPASQTARTTGKPTAHSPAPPLARSVPVRLRIAAIGVDTPVMGLGLAADGTVAVPPIEAHSPAGWYDGSPTPGQTGPSVILGHVTVGSYGDGVFLRLSHLKAGDRIDVGLKDGATATFTVDSVETIPKSRFPTAKVYGNVNHPALRLITCGGNRVSGSGYQDNVVVYASLTSGTTS